MTGTTIWNLQKSSQRQHKDGNIQVVDGLPGEEHCEMV